MNNLVTKAKQQEFIVWTQQSSQEVPSSMDPLKQLGENYILLEQELREKGFATDYLVQSTKK